MLKNISKGNNMGINIFHKNCSGIVYQDKIVKLNPDPKNFKIEKILELENTYVEVLYPDAKNYEGLKVMVFKGKVAKKILALTELDPHFDNSGKLSPIA